MIKKPDPKDVFRALRHILENKPRETKLYTRLHSLRNSEPVKGLLKDYHLIHVCHVANGLLKSGVFDSRYSKYAKLEDAKAALEKSTVREEIEKRGEKNGTDGSDEFGVDSPFDLLAEAPVEKEEIKSSVSLLNEGALGFRSTPNLAEPRPKNDNNEGIVEIQDSKSHVDDVPKETKTTTSKTGTALDHDIPAQTPAQQQNIENTTNVEVSDSETATTQAAMDQAVLFSDSSPITAKIEIPESEPINEASKVGSTETIAVNTDPANTNITEITFQEAQRSSACATAGFSMKTQKIAPVESEISAVAILETKSTSSELNGIEPKDTELKDIELDNTELEPTSPSELQALLGGSINEKYRGTDVTPAQEKPAASIVKEPTEHEMLPAESAPQNIESASTEAMTHKPYEVPSEMIEVSVAKSEPIQVNVSKANVTELGPAEFEPANLQSTQLLPVEAQEISVILIKEVTNAETSEIPPIAFRYRDFEITSTPENTQLAEDAEINTKADVKEVPPLVIKPANAAPAKHEPGTVEARKTDAEKTGLVRTVLWKAVVRETSLEKKPPDESQSAKIEVPTTEPAKGRKKKKKSGIRLIDPTKAECWDAPQQTAIPQVESLDGQVVKIETSQTEISEDQLEDEMSAEVESSKMEPAKTKTTKTEPAKAESPKAGPPKAKSSKKVSASTSSKKDEVAKVKAVKRESPQNEDEETVGATKLKKDSKLENAVAEIVHAVEPERKLPSGGVSPRAERRSKLRAEIEKKLKTARSDQAWEEEKLRKQVFATAVARAAKERENDQVSAESEIAEQETEHTSPDTELDGVEASIEDGKTVLDPELEIDLSDLIKSSDLRQHATINIPHLLSFYLPYQHQHQIMTRLQNMLEQSCFTYLQRRDPELFRKFRQDVECAESVELNRYIELLSTLNFDEAAISKLPRATLKVWNSIKLIRHASVHRNRVPVQALKQFLSDAEGLAGLLEDPKAAEFFGKWKNEVHQTAVGLKDNKKLIEGRLSDVLKDLAAKRAELDRIEKEAVEAMVKDDKEYRNVVGANLAKTLETPPPPTLEEPKGLWARMKAYFL